MPYDRSADLPGSVRDSLPKDAQKTIYPKAFDDTPGSSTGTATVALAKALDAPLLTSDARLGELPEPRIRIEFL